MTANDWLVPTWWHCLAILVAVLLWRVIARWRGRRRIRDMLAQCWDIRHEWPDGVLIPGLEHECPGPLDELMPEVADRPAMIALVAFCDIMRTPKFRVKAKAPILELLRQASLMRKDFIEGLKNETDEQISPFAAEVIEQEEKRIRDYVSAWRAWSAVDEKQLIGIDWHDRRPAFLGEFHTIAEKDMTQ